MMWRGSPSKELQRGNIQGCLRRLSAFFASLCPVRLRRDFALWAAFFAAFFLEATLRLAVAVFRLLLASMRFVA
jgi:hypothetical protein